LKQEMLVCQSDAQHAQWLKLHLEVLAPAADVRCIDSAELDNMLKDQSSGPEEVEGLLFFAVNAAAANGAADSMARMERLCRLAVRPPVVVIAENGNESCAVRAMRCGAADYVTRESLTPALLGELLRHAARTGPSPEALELIPEYSTIRLLGESSRSAVYLARSRMLGNNVALKISHATLEDEEQDRDQLEREHAAVAAIDHPSVVKIHGYGIEAGREYLAMDYFPCGDLKARLRHPLTYVQALRYARRIAEGLQVVHSHGLMHRDLKPPNIMLRPDASIVLIDFGLAKRVGSLTRRTAAGVLRGSPYYMSPEQTLGMDLDHRSDLYSLGVILFELLSGDKPYQGSSALEVMEQHSRGARPNLAEVHAEVEPTLAMLMATERDERFPDAAAAVAALTALEQSAAQSKAATVLSGDYADVG
jgi:DNA-binding NarL/FixJ family response regulator